MSTLFSGVSLLAMILLAGPWLKQIPMAALVAVMISIAVSTADINGLRNLRRIPKSDTSVMLMTFAVTMLTTPHNLALGVLAGVALAGILFSLKAVEQLEAEGVSVELIDLISLKPFDMETISRSIRKTNKVIVVEECMKTGGIGACLLYTSPSPRD